MKADIVEIFSSWQGEGIYLGEKQIFVRFAGCNVNCLYCDTLPEKFVKIVETKDALNEILSLENELGPHHAVSLTGGEPLLYKDFLRELLPNLKEKNLKIYLETNGTLWNNLAEILEFIDIIAMDIKLPSSTFSGSFWKEHLRFIEIAKSKNIFIKVIITNKTKQSDLKKAVNIIRSIDKNITLIIQPANLAKKGITSSKNISPRPYKIIDFRDTAKRYLNDVRIIPQVHKILGVK